MNLIVRNRLGVHTLNDLLRQAKLASVDTGGACTIDCTRLTDVNAVGLVGLMLLLKQLERKRYRITVELPSTRRVREAILGNINPHVDDATKGLRRYLTDPGVYWTSEQTAGPDHTVRHDYLRLFHLTCLNDGIPLLEEIRSNLRNNLRLPADATARFCEAFSELCQNIHEHSQSPIGGFAAIDLLWTGMERRVILALGDLGIGIRCSLTNAGLTTGSDHDAISRAVQRGVTSKRGNDGRGGGLARCREHAQDQGYAFGIRSGRGYWISIRGKEQASIEGFCPGTQVYFAFGRF